MEEFFNPIKMDDIILKPLFLLLETSIDYQDERNQVLTTNCWLSLQWQDHHLKWESEKYGGIPVIRFNNHFQENIYGFMISDYQ